MKNIIKNCSLLILFILSVLFFGSTNNKTNAISSEKFVGEVQLGGHTIGIKIKTNVEIVGKYEIVKDNMKFKPWENSDILEGDFIYSVDNVLVKSNEDLNNIIKNSEKDKVKLCIIRGDELIETEINIIKNVNNINSIGLYIKDHISGIGTLTFVNLETNKFGALGHSVSDALGNGQLYDSSVKGIKKAVSGIPGEKFATLSNESIGVIKKNIDIGIFGDLDDDINGRMVKIVDSDYVTRGPAKIVTVLSGNIIKEYNIEIVEVAKQNSPNIKGIKFKVIDEELLSQAGGIIQGMSGSPIIQNGNLVGAVSHVLVNEPKFGFGVFAEWMYYETK